MPSIDLNCDLGESFGAYTIGMDAEILPYVTSANIACGVHAGDPSVMQKCVLLCKKYGVQVGAHPGLPDLQGFGRRRMAISPAEAEADVMYQIGALKAFCDAAGVPLHHVKPHGALYNMAARDPVLAAAICRAVQAAAPGAVLLALSGSEMVKAANAIGLPVASEVFADRGYQADGSLVPRGAPGAMIENEDTAIAQVLQDGSAGYRTGRRRQHRNPAGRFRLRPRRRPQSPRLRVKNLPRPPCRRDSSCSILIVGRKQDGE